MALSRQQVDILLELWGINTSGEQTRPLGRDDVLRLIHRNGDKGEGLTLAEKVLLEADLHGLKLQGADLRGANLLGADLQGARLNAANLQEARFFSANLPAGASFGFGR